jgi:hypothetical protein
LVNGWRLAFWDDACMAAVLGAVFLLFVFLGIPTLCRVLIRRMGASQGLRRWLNAYGPRFPIAGRDESDDGADT